MSTIVTGTTIVTTLEIGQGPSGPPGPPGPPSGSGAQYAAATAVSGHRVMALDAAGEAFPASCDTLSHALRIAGLSLNAADQGDPVTVLGAGLVDHAGWAWTPDTPLYLGLNGALVDALPGGAVFAQVMGKAVSATRVLIAVQPPIVLV